MKPTEEVRVTVETTGRSYPRRKGAKRLEKQAEQQAAKYWRKRNQEQPNKVAAVVIEPIKEEKAA